MSLIDGGILTDYLHSHQTSIANTYIYSAVGYTTIQIPVDVYSIYVECWGGGAGGQGMADAGNNTYSNNGGGGGGYAASILSVIPGEYYSFEVGDGGIGGNSPTWNAGAGGASFFGLSGCNTNTAIVRGCGGAGIAGGGITGIGNLGNTITEWGGSAAFISNPTVNPIKTSGGGGAAGPGGRGTDGSKGDGNGGQAAGGAGDTGSTFSGAGGDGYPLDNPTYPPNVDYGQGSPGLLFGGGGGGAGCWHTPGGTDVYGGSGAQGLIRITYYI